MSRRRIRWRAWSLRAVFWVLAAIFFVSAVLRATIAVTFAREGRSWWLSAVLAVLFLVIAVLASTRSRRPFRR